MHKEVRPKVGDTVFEVSLEKDAGQVLFRLRGVDGKDGVARWNAEGDCCSRSWVEHMEVPVLPATVLPQPPEEIERCDWPSRPEHALLTFQDGELPASHEDVIRPYHATLILSSGHLRIDMRNESNGYYSGSLEFAGFEEVKP